MERRIGAEHRPQGQCPRSWVALLDGAELRDYRGVLRRYESQEGALRAARKEARG